MVDTDECWLWAGYVNERGYGRFTARIDGKNKGFAVHRIMYEDAKGEIPEGLVLDHLCRVRRCVNPDHLEPVTSRENILRGNGIAGLNSRKTHCFKGHAYTAVNTYMIGNRRRCIACRPYLAKWV